MKRLAFSLVLLTAAPAYAEPGAQDSQAQTLYQTKCASCHGAERLGGIGPALLPDNLGRLGKSGAEMTIREGRAATQMPSFKNEIDDAGIKALAAYVYSAPNVAAHWAQADIEASRVLTPAPAADKPKFSADPLNLFVVVEGGDHHVSILDGDKFEPIFRFKSRFALHGGPKFTPDGRYVFFSSRDGWVTKFDLWTLQVTAEIRAGINSRNIAISKDGKHIAVANYLPDTLVILSADDLEVEKIFEVADLNKHPSRVSAVYQAPTRDSFIAALKDAPEIWEISTDPHAPPVYSGLVHSNEKSMIEALPSAQGLFALRRIEISEPLDDFFFDPSYRDLLGANRDGGKAVVVNLTVGEEIATIPLPGMPHLGSGISWMRDGRRVMATPHLKEGKISVIDTTDWKVIAEIPTAGPGFFMRSHENSPYVWTDSFLSPTHKDEIQIIDKNSLKVVRSLKPAPGKTTAHVEFDRSGRHALVSVMEMDGALIVYDADTFEEIKRIPMSKPIGKYNVYNKITFSEGTSH
ncbi:cytochrome D1 domain-containing protein [Rhodoblastus sp.]|uniref:cytochrome D1 domain-containing protein n=1 Tax=Rhodoblastus sp. TaxID=1962975 RepID=UPI0026278679|nr:cytochrome D1 domain-containing protein [Rhodoblastus sp.]